MRPANVPVRLPDPLDGDIELMRARPADAPGLARRLWDLTEWSERARGLVRRLDALPPGGPEALAPGFELSAAVLRHLQADPLLPSELLPGDWPGAALRSTYDAWDARYRATLSDWSNAPT
jgi:phenylacetic acid degradation operon negative regulatory protein